MLPLTFLGEKMRLRQAIVEGKKCNPQLRVMECVTNAELYIIPMLPYSEQAEAYRTLENDVQKYVEGHLILDWNGINHDIDNEVQELLKGSPL
jgi:hypothetical protein